MSGRIFKTYRANELADVPSFGQLHLKVTGANGAESKWLTISDTELEKIIAVLEPEDYATTLQEMGLDTAEADTYAELAEKYPQD